MQVRLELAVVPVNGEAKRVIGPRLHHVPDIGAESERLRFALPLRFHLDDNERCVDDADCDVAAAGQGEEALLIPAMGGSLPEYVWTRVLGVPAFVIPYANHDEANHAPNENIEVERFIKGIKTGAALRAFIRTAPDVMARARELRKDPFDLNAIREAIKPWGERLRDRRFETEGEWKLKLAGGTRGTVEVLTRELRDALR